MITRVELIKKKQMKKINLYLTKIQDLVLLDIRLVVAYSFYGPAKIKVQDINSIAEWFQSINIPMPVFNAYLATGTEILGVVLLTLGLFSRFISFPLIITMIVAIVTVHFANGFEAGNNGFEIPLYYILMLLTLITFGSGKISVDHLIERFKNKIQN